MKKKADQPEKPVPPAAWQPPDAVLVGARVLAAAVLLTSGVMKAAGPAEEFALVIESYGVLRSPDAILALSRLLPWAEALIGFALLYGVRTRAAAAAACGLFSVFIVALGSVLARGVELPDCGCFGFGVHLKPSQTIVLDLFVLGCAALVARSPRAPLSLDNWTDGGYT